MGLRSLLRKASIGLGSLLLACNIGCSKYYLSPPDDHTRPQPTNLEEEVSFERPKRLRAWQYPVNIAGGFFTHILIHEGGHAAAALAQGVGIKEFHPYPGSVNGSIYGGWVRYEKESYNNSSSQERAIMSIAGPAADIALAETINYNLRNGNISPAHQPFWATTSLMARAGPIWIAIGSLKNRAMNDFSHFERDTGVPKETTAGLVALYTVLNAQRIAKELRVALGRDSYDYKPERKGELSLVPVNNGLGLTYTIKF